MKIEHIAMYVRDLEEAKAFILTLRQEIFTTTRQVILGLTFIL